ncbi:MAG: acetyl-CoA carboxylase, biotin carboxyl carrier protein [Armatimonadota bacterium]|nr:MAG: acetyl-CoA carboxylase, biotin carboxyl carrier protein [Armatimonadota bacterium]
MVSDEIAQTEMLLRLARRFHLSELEWQEDGLRIFIRRERATVEVPQDIPAPVAVPAKTPEASEQAVLVDLCAPMTGVFYRAPSPDAPPYVEVGDYVEEGQIVCLIEAMKVFNEIPAERSGRIVQICAESGQLVEQGAVLFRLEPEEETA